MKQRTGFVSNSSSSSFVLNKEFLSEYQVWQIFNHIQEAERMVASDFKDSRERLIYPNDGDAWDVVETLNTIRLDTYMDNFEMSDFLDLINVDEKAYIKKKRDGDW